MQYIWNEQNNPRCDVQMTKKTRCKKIIFVTTFLGGCDMLSLEKN